LPHGSTRRAAALQQIAKAKELHNPSDVLPLLRAAEKFFDGSRPRLTQHIADLQAQVLLQRVTKIGATASKPELEPVPEPDLDPEPEPEPERESEPESKQPLELELEPEPLAPRSVEAQEQTDALMALNLEKKVKKRKQKHNGLLTPIPEPVQSAIASVLASLEPQLDVPEPQSELPQPEPEFPELPEFRRLAELLGRLALAQYLPLCIKHEFDMDTLMICNTTDLVDIGLPPGAADMIATEIKRVKDAAEDPEAAVEEAINTYSAVEIAAWDDETVSAWLQTIDLGGETELAAMLSVELDGDDLAEASDISLKAQCKRVAKRHQELDWGTMRQRLLSARDRALAMGHMERVGSELRYDLSKPLGRQGCQVWEGKLKDGRTCAVKQVDSVQGQKESELLTRITSAGACAHIITYYNFEAAPDGRMFLAMELADQGTLADWKASGRLEALNWAERKAVGHELCTGLAFLHNTASIVHRDLKPENLLFKSETGRGGERVTLMIADFGLSRSINHSRSRRDTSSGGVGTDCWMPPEGLQGHCGGLGDMASLTFSYDVHPAGSLLYYVLCAGVHAFPGRNDVERRARPSPV
jgi:hypothetical protein